MVVKDREPPAAPRVLRRPYETGARQQVRPPPASLAEWVADELRARILDGRLSDGESLPKQDELVEEFGVSKPSTREAFRILETEGLITVRRGSIGGSVVHAPRAESVAYMLGLVLQSGSAQLADVGRALREIEPLCASLCANRSDRRRAVIPILRRQHQWLVQAIEADDQAEAVPASRAFHEAVVACCGNQTMIAFAGALEVLWSAHEQAWATEAVMRGEFPDPELRRKALDEHQILLDLIEVGDADAAALVARRHLEEAQLYPLAGDHDRLVNAGLLRSATLGR
jgi:GntR family transcriptional regulator, transcriptional repressor for pyruvate dehydrogenase complex